MPPILQFHVVNSGLSNRGVKVVDRYLPVTFLLRVEVIALRRRNANASSGIPSFVAITRRLPRRDKVAIFHEVTHACAVHCAVTSANCLGRFFLYHRVLNSRRGRRWKGGYIFRFSVYLFIPGSARQFSVGKHGPPRVSP